MRGVRTYVEVVEDGNALAAAEIAARDREKLKTRLAFEVLCIQCVAFSASPDGDSASECQPETAAGAGAATGSAVVGRRLPMPTSA